MRFARAGGSPDLSAVALRALCGLSAEAEGRGAFSAPYGSALLVYYRAGGGRSSPP